MLLRARSAALISIIIAALFSTLLYLHLGKPGITRKVWRTASSFMSTTDTKPDATVPQGSLKEWLLSRKKAYLSDLQAGGTMSKWILTTGNEAGDLDSLASAVGLSYLQYRFNANPGHHVPLIQTPRDDLRLRPENERALRDAQIPVDALLWLDEADVQAASARHARLILVDHNRATSRFGEQPEVVALLDHHQDEGLYKDAVPRVVTTGVGSCASLVTTHYRKFWQIQEHTPLLSSLASILSDAILIDTINLKNVPGKATETDYDAFSLLSPYLPGTKAASALAFTPDSRPSPERFELLSQLKTGISHLSPRDLLRRDYKQFSTSSRTAGFSTVPQSLKDWNWEEALSEWAAEQHLDAAFILTSYENAKGKRRKDVVALVPAAGSDAKLKEAVFVGFPKEGHMLALEDSGNVKTLARGAELKVWKQGNTSQTRKRTAPAVMRALEQAPRSE